MLRLETIGTRFTENRKLSNIKYPVIIIAGSYVQADHCAKNVLKLPSRNHFIYAYDYRKLNGLRGNTLYLYGTWYNKHDIGDMLAHARAREFEIIELEDNR